MISYIHTPSGALTLLVDGKPIEVAADHPALAQILAAVGRRDAAAVRRLASASTAVAEYTLGRVTVRGEKVLVDGREVGDELPRTIVRMMRDGHRADAYIRFLDRLEANPSRRARRELFPFLNHHGIPITEDGMFVGYKRLDANWESFRSGPNTTYVDHPDGTTTVFPPHTRIKQAVGDRVRVVRNEVDEDYGIDCSDGLHVGAMSYVETFNQSKPGSVITLNLCDPADVVTVPRNETNKLRIASYRVVGTYEATLDASPVYSGTTLTPVAPTPAPADGTRYAIRKGNGDDETERVETWLTRDAARARLIELGDAEWAKYAEDDVTTRNVTDDTYEILDDVGEMIICFSIEEDDDDLAEDEDDDIDDEDYEDYEDDEDDLEPPSGEYAYRYLVTACPRCKSDLTQGSAIELDLSLAGKIVPASSSLDSDGDLADTDDYALEKGLHSETRCSTCRLVLTPWEQQFTHGVLDFGPRRISDVDVDPASLTLVAAIVDAVGSRDDEPTTLGDMLATPMTETPEPRPVTPPAPASIESRVSFRDFFDRIRGRKKP